MKIYKQFLTTITVLLLFLISGCDDNTGSNSSNNTNNTNNSNNSNNINNTNNVIGFNPSGINPGTITAHNSFYVDPLNGNDENDGSIENPWQHIQFVVDNYVSTTEYDSYPFDQATDFVDKNPDGPVKSGDEIVLRSGFHEALEIKSAYNTGFITIRGYEGETASLSQITIEAASNWRVTAITISKESDLNPNNQPLLTINNHNFFGPTSTILVDHCEINTLTDSSSWSIDDWNNLSCNGAEVSGDHVMLANNHFKNVNFGISFTGDFGDCLNNKIENFAGDGLRGLGNDLLFEGNTVKNCYDVNENHDDGFQSWAIDGVAPKRIVLRGNTILNFEDPNQQFRGPLQGIGCFDGFYDTWIVENNLIITDHWHGITFLGAKDVKIINNTVIDADPDTDLNPWIMISDHKDGTPSEGCIIRNNVVAHKVQGDGDVTLDHNITLGATDLGIYFSDPINNDFYPNANSPLIDSGSDVEAPATDISGTARPQINGVDIGAYEFLPIK